MKKVLLLLAVVFGAYASSFSQSSSFIKNDQLLRSELGRRFYDIDTNAKAVILYEDGSLDFNYGSYAYTYDIIAKILSDDGVSDFSEIAIPKRRNTLVNSIYAETFNLTGNGIERNKLERSNIIKDKIQDQLKVIKFSIPNVRKGTIVHYTYTVYKTDPVSIPDFPFQHLYPTLHSRYSINAPTTLSFNKILRSGKKFSEAQREVQLDTCEACEYNDIKESKRYVAWATRNVPAFKKEPYSGSKDNFLERIKILITGYYNSNGQKIDVFNTWSNFSKKYLFYDDDYTGQVFKSNSFLDETVAGLTMLAPNNYEKAKVIFYYVRANYRETESDGYDLKTVFRNKAGNAESINLLLVAMMKKAGLDCDPAVFTSRSKERLTSLYPNPFDLNRVAAVFRNEKKLYLLDASSKGLPFGTLPADCYNGYTWVVNKEGYAIDLSPDDLKEKHTTVVNIEPESEYVLSVKIDQKLGIFQSARIREEARGDSAEAVKIIARLAVNNNPEGMQGSISVKNMNDPEQPLKVHYEGKLPLDKAASIQYFNPYLSRFFSQNPFPATERELPVEMDYTEDYTYLLNLKLPERFSFDDIPQSANLKFSEQGLMSFTNSYSYDETNKTITLSSRFLTGVTVFPASSYKDIRSFYEHMIQEQNKKITIKKITP